MTPIAIIFVLLAAFLLFRLPKQWAALPLLAGVGYMTLGQQIELGPLHFTVIRILVAVGVARVISRGERLGGLNGLDKLMIAWGICALISSFFHNDVLPALISRLGIFYDGLGVYFLLRFFLQEDDSIHALSRIVIIVLAPVAVEMVFESVTGRNSFSFLGGIGAESEVRNGTIRAQGPFAHSILAGTVGATCWPLFLPFWQKHRKLALLGLAVCGSMVVTSRSSGPIMTALFVTVGLCAWKFRYRMRIIRWTAVAAIVALEIIMNAPVYYLLSRIDLTGSSTGWHRAEVIHAAITHLDEWWFAGTDYTRHWIMYGVHWSKDHIDITNEYIKMGVLGGLPLMTLFIATLVAAFISVGRSLRANECASFEKRFTIWALGAILFGHSMTFMSVTYFDQSFVFFLLVLAGIGSLPKERKAPERVLTQNARVLTHEEWAESLS